MPAYHSTFAVDPARDRMVGNFALLPLRSAFRGPATRSLDDYDITEECLDLYRANALFKNFEIKTPADRVLIYGILFIGECLGHLRPHMSLSESQKTLTNVALDNFRIPGEPGFGLSGVFSVPSNDRTSMDLLRGYLQQFRQELATRLLQRVYEGDTPSKFWLAFTKRKFMNRSL